MSSDSSAYSCRRCDRSIDQTNLSHCEPSFCLGESKHSEFDRRLFAIRQTSRMVLMVFRNQSPSLNAAAITGSRKPFVLQRLHLRIGACTPSKGVPFPEGLSPILKLTLAMTFCRNQRRAGLSFSRRYRIRKESTGSVLNACGADSSCFNHSNFTAGICIVIRSVP